LSLSLPKDSKGVIVAPAMRELSVLAEQLAGWLAARIPGAQDLKVVDLDYPRGAGQSHETILFDAVWTEAGHARRRGLVVRIKPTRHTMFPDDLFTEQYQLMRLVHQGGYLPVAEPLWFEEDPTLLGAPFFVMEKLAGRVAVSVPPYAVEGWVAEASPEQRRRLWENGVRQLAAVQKVPLASVQFLAGNGAAAQGLEQEWDKYRRFLDWITELRPWPLLESAMQQLRARWPKNQPPGLVWGDARLGNLLVDDDFRVAAVMDWEQPSLGGALQDLAWWLVISDSMHSTGSGRPHLEGMGTREETIALWEEITGVSTADLEWYEDFTRLKHAILSVRMDYLRGRPTPTEDYPDTPQFRAFARRLDLPWPAG
jgi:aminoglycoside phosphotransferase (APT) family kinase protein